MSVKNGTLLPADSPATGHDQRVPQLKDHNLSFYPILGHVDFHDGDGPKYGVIGVTGHQCLN